MIDPGVLANSFLKDYTKIDNVATLYSHCQNVRTDPVTAYRSFVELARVFSKVFARREIVAAAARRCGADADPGQDEHGALCKWLLKYLEGYRIVTVEMLCGIGDDFRAAAADSILLLLKIDFGLNKSFNEKFLMCVITKILSLPQDDFQQSGEVLCSKINPYTDLRGYFYSAIRSILAGKTIDLHGRTLPDVCTLLEYLDPPRSGPPKGDPHMYLPGCYAAHREPRHFTLAWLQLIASPMSGDLIKKVLLVLHRKVLPFVNCPESFMDFITSCYDKGGSFSVLALSSLHKMILDYNIEYPNFYSKLYEILNHQVMHLKYRSRLMRLIYSSLRPGSLPDYIVAAFIKKLLRISLTSPAPAILAILPVVYNLIRIHPSLESLIHASSSSMQSQEDPYLFDEPDPLKSRAIKSSLWELLLLENHYCKQVAETARYFRVDPSKSPLLEVEDYLDNTYATLASESASKKLDYESILLPSKSVAMRLPGCTVTLS